MNPSFFILLFVTFIDFMGMGLIYPIFSSLLFDQSLTFLPPNTTQEMRGFWLGLLFALLPLVQLFSSPVWGTISDCKGRKKPLQFSLVITMLGHLISLFGVFFSNIALLLLSRMILGFGCGNIAIVQASIADLSTTEEKAKNFGLYSMAIGAGFTLGPFFGGFFSKWGYSVPFFFASLITAINLLLAYALLKETHHLRFAKKLNWTTGLSNLKRSFHIKNIRVLFLCSFLNAFAWSYFMDFFPVYLIRHFQFSTAKIGLFYGTIGAFYALSAGVLIRPLLSRLKPETMFFGGSFFTAFCVFTVPFYPSIIWLMPFVVFFSYFSAILPPTATTIVSNSASSEIQGEVLGVLGSVNTASYTLSALLAGIFIGLNPSLCMWIGGICFMAAAIIFLGVYRSRLLNPLK
jgi:MFS transporter, DHA1 family, tetracycline resistance protein